MRMSRESADLLSEVSNEILIVDDNCFNILALQGLIQQNFKLQIDSANDGDQALNKVKQKYRMMNRETYKLILMDFSMPVMDGPTAAKQILAFLDTAASQNKGQKNGLQRRPYMCCFSAYQQPSYEEKALEAGMDMFEDKCIDEHKLRRILTLAKLLPESAAE